MTWMTMSTDAFRAAVALRRTWFYLAIAMALTSAGLSAMGAGAAVANGLTAPHLMAPLVPGSAPAIVFGQVSNHGGPVQLASAIYVDFWGWTTDPSGEAPYLTQFLSGIGGTPWLNTVTQYGANNPQQVLRGTWLDPTPAPAQPTDAQVQSEAARAADHFGVGSLVSVNIMVATPTGHTPPGFGSNFCAYHGAVGARPNITYTLLPYMTDAGASCGAGVVHGAQGGRDGVSIVAGHEVAEVMTDPLLTTWYDAVGLEIADKCAWTGLTDIGTSSGSFPVQALWSNAANGCVLSSNRAPTTDLFFVKTIQTSGHVEVHSATVASGYQVGQHVVTSLSPGDAGNGWFQMDDSDLFLIKTLHTSSGRVELHSSTAASGYQDGQHIATRLSSGDAGNGFFQMVGPDLFFIKVRNTGSGQVEIHSATAASGYQIGQDLVTWMSSLDNANGWFQMVGTNLFFIKSLHTSSGRVELHSATAGSGYRDGQHNVTWLSTGDAGNGWFQMVAGDMFFTKTLNTGSGRVEVHSATAGSGYRDGQHNLTWLSTGDAGNGWFQIDTKG
jgi:hypothetical protein